jgi:hypothetical protein
LDWAAAALETASNRPLLPHVIVVMNASDNNIPEKQWSVEHSTTSTFNDLKEDVMERNETFIKYAKFWLERNRPVNSVEQLMLSYYSSVQVNQLSITVIVSQLSANIR